tara:strand:+ start:1069 stop:2130 length:1062 start_codon:yes stop_codon:yes gene_type:complete
MYKRFNDNDIVTIASQELVTSTWTGNTNNLTVAHTASSQADFTTSTSSGHFFIDVYNEHTSSTTEELQYSIAYGHSAGSGSPDFTNDTGSFGMSAARTNYSQFRQLHFNDDTKFFTFGTHNPDNPTGIYIINIARARYKQKLTLGTLNLEITGKTLGVGASEHTTIDLTDDSVVNEPIGNSVSLGPYYNIVSGSSGQPLTGTTATTQVGTSASYGHFYPEAGLIILMADAFTGDLSGGLNPGGPDPNVDKNHETMFNAISASGNFIVDTTEEVNSEYYFCRARNDQYNYTNNESFIDANKNVFHESMKLNPKVFITTVGLYNDAYELLAVAKLSQPVAKDFTKEALIRVKLDY